jgi:hypothetical protein
LYLLINRSILPNFSFLEPVNEKKYPYFIRAMKTFLFLLLLASLSATSYGNEDKTKEADKAKEGDKTKPDNSAHNGTGKNMILNFKNAMLCSW